MTLFFHDTVDVLRPATRETRSQETELDYTALAEATEPPLCRPWAGVQVRPVSQALTVAVDRDTRISEWFIATDHGAADFDVLPTDWIRLADGTVCTIVGDVARPSDPLRGGLDHINMRVRRAIN